MPEEAHTDDLRNVREGDTLSFTTTDGLAAVVDCTDRQTQNADPRTGEVRETTIWTFEQDDTRLYASILEGLKSSPDDPDFPVHNQVYNPDTDESHGYVKTLQIHGQMEEA